MGSRGQSSLSWLWESGSCEGVWDLLVEFLVGKVMIFLVVKLQSSSFAGAEQLLNNAVRTFEWLTFSKIFGSF